MEETAGQLHTENQDEAKQPQYGGFAEIVKITLRAAYWFLFCGALLCAVLTAIFPYGSMKFYSKLGMPTLARQHAQRVVSRGVKTSNDENGAVKYSFKGERPEADSKFADALYYFAIPLTVDKFNTAVAKKGINSSAAVRSAKQVVKNGDIYAMFNSARADGVWQADAIAYAAEQGAASAHPDLYSFKTIVRRNYMKAKYVAYPSEIPSELVRLYHIVRDPETLSANTMDEYSVWFAELNAIINVELDLVGYRGNAQGSNLEQILSEGVTVGSYFRYLYAKQEFTEQGVTYPAGKQDSLLVLEQRIETLKDYIYAYDTQNKPEEYLRRAYWARQLSLLTQNIRVVTDILYADRGGSDTIVSDKIQALRNEWQHKFDWYDLHNGTPGGHAYDWYNMILTDYTKQVSA